MSKISVKELKKNIIENNIKNIYYFFGENYFLIDNFSNKIFEIYDKNFRSSMNFLAIDEYTLQSEKFKQFIFTPPMGFDKKFILLTSTSLRENNKIFYDDFLNILYNLSEFCVFIINDIYENKCKKNLYYNSFLDKVSEISELSEFKLDNSSIQKQAILWAKKFDKELNPENSLLLCEKCCYDIKLIKDSIENLCLSSKDKEISEELINKNVSKFNKTFDIYDISKSIRNKNISLAMKITNYFIEKNENPMRILSILISDFMDALRVKEAKKNKIQISEVSKIFGYSGREFKLKYAEILERNFDVDQIVSFLIKSDLMIKSIFISQKLILKSFFIILKKYSK